MATHKDFSLISVASDEDDDVVIQAGVLSGVGGTNGAGEAGALSGAMREDVAPHEVASDEAARDEGVLNEVASGEAVHPTGTQMLTTEEDLRAPMPFANMQRIIMVVFILLIVAAAIYWFFIRPLGA